MRFSEASWVPTLPQAAGLALALASELSCFLSVSWPVPQSSSPHTVAHVGELKGACLLLS